MIPLILCIFVLGYLAIALEHKLHINKAAPALFIGIVCWSLYVCNVGTLMPQDAIPGWFNEESLAEQVQNIPLHFAIENQRFLCLPFSIT